MITTTAVRTWELDRTPDLVDLVSAARDGGHEVMLIERPMPDAVSVAALGRVYDMVAAPGGVALELATGEMVDFEPGDDRLLAAARLWRRLRENMAPVGPIGTGPIAVGGFAYRPDRDPGGPWSGFPALLFRVPALAVTNPVLSSIIGITLFGETLGATGPIPVAVTVGAIVTMIAGTISLARSPLVTDENARPAITPAAP